MTSERTRDWVDGMAHRLIRHAARRAPDALSERLEEEWLADLAEQHGRLSRLRFAIGCCWATNVITRELATAAVPATSSPIGQGHFIGTPQDDFPFFTGRTITFMLVATLHAAVLYGLAMGLGPTLTKVNIDPLVPTVIEKPARGLPPPPPLKISPTRIVTPPQDPMPPIESEPKDVVQATPRESPAHVPPYSGPHAVNRVPGGPGIGFPSTNDFYPDISIRMGEKGVATLRACVDGKGRLTSDPTIVQSSGSTRLDEGALRLAKAGSGHYRATTEDGQPVESCYPFRIRFDLRN